MLCYVYFESLAECCIFIIAKLTAKLCVSKTRGLKQSVVVWRWGRLTELLDMLPVHKLQPEALIRSSLSLQRSNLLLLLSALLPQLRQVLLIHLQKQKHTHREVSKTDESCCCCWDFLHFEKRRRVEGRWGRIDAWAHRDRTTGSQLSLIGQTDFTQLSTGRSCSSDCDAPLTEVINTWKLCQNSHPVLEPWFSLITWYIYL